MTQQQPVPLKDQTRAHIDRIVREYAGDPENIDALESYVRDNYPYKDDDGNELGGKYLRSWDRYVTQAMDEYHLMKKLNILPRKIGINAR